MDRRSFCNDAPAFGRLKALYVLIKNLFPHLFVVNTPEVFEQIERNALRAPTVRHCINFNRISHLVSSSVGCGNLTVAKAGAVASRSGGGSA